MSSSYVVQGHQRGSSYNGVCAFVQPESNLETSLIRRSSLAHTNSIAMATGRGGVHSSAGAYSNSSMDSQQSSVASSFSVRGYVDTVVDQYVVIEASPSGSISSTRSTLQEVRHPLVM